MAKKQAQERIKGFRMKITDIALFDEQAKKYQMKDGEYLSHLLKGQLQYAPRDTTSDEIREMRKELQALRREKEFTSSKDMEKLIRQNTSYHNELQAAGRVIKEMQAEQERLEAELEATVKEAERQVTETYSLISKEGAASKALEWKQALESLKQQLNLAQHKLEDIQFKYEQSTSRGRMDFTSNLSKVYFFLLHLKQWGLSQVKEQKEIEALLLTAIIKQQADKIALYFDKWNAFVSSKSGFGGKESEVFLMIKNLNLKLPQEINDLIQQSIEEDAVRNNPDIFER